MTSKDDTPRFEPLDEKEEQELLRLQRRRKIVMGSILGAAAVLLILFTIIYLGTTDLALFGDQDVFRSP